MAKRKNANRQPKLADKLKVMGSLANYLAICIEDRKLPPIGSEHHELAVLPVLKSDRTRRATNRQSQSIDGFHTMTKPANGRL
jgi:hypothetical protein